MNLAPATELIDRTKQRGSQAVEQFLVPFTDMAEYLRDLKADYDAEPCAIQDKIVRVSTNTSRASQEDIEGPGSAGGHRLNPWYRRVYVRCTYVARGQLVQLSRYCGVALSDAAPEGAWDYGRPLSEASALAVQEMHTKLANVLETMRDLDVRGGGFMIADGVWLPEPDETIAAAPQERCATCDQPIYFANLQWRHKATKRAETLVDGHGLRGQLMKVLDHLADPTEKGRLV